jgi:molybdopterin molybdotransferase
MAGESRLLPVAEAQRRVLEHARAAAAETLPLHSVLGLVLAEDVVSDVDSPPHDKALMDGYAVRSADLLDGRASLDVVQEITAGQVPRLPVHPGQAARVMTGAPVPDGADAVVMVERTRVLADGRVGVEDRPARPGQHILRRGTELRAGETVLKAGVRLRPQDVGLLATVGREQVAVVPPPHVAVLATGDELVEASLRPGPGHIRNSNGPMLEAQVVRAGGVPRPLGIAADHEDSLRPLIEQGLRTPVLLLSGGVSAGKLDLVPGVLAGLGVRPHFHKIEMKPGKPLFFGTAERAAGTTLVFGLPGNPVSSFVCFELFVRPALRRLRGLVDAGPPVLPAAFAEDFAYRSDRPTYHPALLETSADGWRVRAVPWFGSPDLRGLGRANALAVLPPGEGQYRAGQVVSVIPLEGE